MDLCPHATPHPRHRHCPVQELEQHKLQRRGALQGAGFKEAGAPVRAAGRKEE